MHIASPVSNTSLKQINNKRATQKSWFPQKTEDKPLGKPVRQNQPFKLTRMQQVGNTKNITHN